MCIALSVVLVSVLFSFVLSSHIVCSFFLFLDYNTSIHHYIQHHNTTTPEAQQQQ